MLDFLDNLVLQPFVLFNGNEMRSKLELIYTYFCHLLMTLISGGKRGNVFSRVSQLAKLQL